MRSRTMRPRSSSTAIAALLLLAAVPAAAPAQYFGRNKVQYERFDFRILRSPHFDSHFYPAESLATSDAARMAERWYTRLSPLLRSTFDRRSLIFYANSPDFQQTNVVEGFIDQSTGGVTESLRGRVTMPFQSTYAESDHVLGHELVHVFQYNIAFGGSDANAARGLSTIPLWVIEGMAEYMSIGRYDPLTAMWLRDAVQRNDLPTLRQLSTDPRYFPYRYGQAFWAWFAGLFGDAAVERVYRTALRSGWEQALRTVTGRASDSLSAAWHRDIRAQYTPLLADRTAPDSTGRVIVKGGTRNAVAHVSPVVSPDGRYVAYFSSRDLFGYAIFIADARTGEQVRRLTTVTGNAHFDAINFIASTGSWSPDGRQFAFVVFADGDEELNIYDVASGDVVRRLKIPGVGAISDPAWSPDGSRIAISGNAGGVSDLYVVELAGGRVEQLTRGRAAELQPAWSPDGRTIAYATDQGPGYDPGQLTFGDMRLALIEPATGQMRLLPGLASGKHINPQFSPDGAELFFVSDQDGFADIYRTVLATGETFRVTRTATGVSGITRLSPALSVARGDGRILFSVFEQGGFSVHALEAAEARGQPVTAGPPTIAAGGLLPPADVPSGVVARYLGDPTTGLPPAGPDSVTRYRSKISLDYLGVPQAGFGIGGPLGATAQGAVSAIFGDELNNRNIGAAVVAQGTLKDIGAQAYYLNRERRTNWFVGAGRTPYLSLGYDVTCVEGSPETGCTEIREDQIYVRQFFDELSGGVQYPFSTTRRVEFSAGVQRISYDFEADQFFSRNVGLVDVRRGVNLEAPPSVTLAQASVALVGDNSFMAFTSPVAGSRYRFEVTPTFGDLTFQTAVADYRHYFLLRPVTLAFRGLHYGRYGKGGEDNRLYPLYLGNPQLMRGYESNSFDAAVDCTSGTDDPNGCPELTRLLGSRIAVVSAELRVPLFGTSQYGLINLPFLPTELSFFTDAGAAWTSEESTRFAFDRTAIDRVPLVSAGVSARVNVLGYAVVEFYYAKPFQRANRDWVFGFQLAPGW
jgi:Tol biopolymer transport system component